MVPWTLTTSSTRYGLSSWSIRYQDIGWSFSHRSGNSKYPSVCTFLTVCLGLDTEMWSAGQLQSRWCRMITRETVRVKCQLSRGIPQLVVDLYKSVHSHLFSYVLGLRHHITVQTMLSCRDTCSLKLDDRQRSLTQYHWQAYALWKFWWSDTYLPSHRLEKSLTAAQ